MKRVCLVAVAESDYTSGVDVMAMHGRDRLSMAFAVRTPSMTEQTAKARFTGSIQ